MVQIKHVIHMAIVGSLLFFQMQIEVNLLSTITLVDVKVW
jgi:hypothetical protein